MFIYAASVAILPTLGDFPLRFISLKKSFPTPAATQAGVGFMPFAAQYFLMFSISISLDILHKSLLILRQHRTIHRAHLAGKFSV